MVGPPKFKPLFPLSVVIGTAVTAAEKGGTLATHSTGCKAGSEDALRERGHRGLKAKEVAPRPVDSSSQCISKEVDGGLLASVLKRREYTN